MMPHCWAFILTSHQKQQKDKYYPCHVWEGHTLKVLELPSSSFRTDFSQGSNGDLDQQSPRSLDMWIELDVFLYDKLTQVISTKHLFKWTLLENSLHLTCFETPHKRQELPGTIGHTTPRSHTITRVPQSLQQVSSTSSTHLTDQFNNI